MIVLKKRRYINHYKGERKQDYQTPQEFFAKLNERYRFTLDGASTAENALLPRFSTEKQPMAWEGERVFCNPPWSNIAPFIELASVAELAVLLVPARTNVRWFHRALELGGGLELFEGRLRFCKGRTCSGASPVDCLLIVFWRGNGAG